MKKHQEAYGGTSHKHDPNDNITNSELFKFKAEIIKTRTAAAAGNTKHLEISVY